MITSASEKRAIVELWFSLLGVELSQHEGEMLFVNPRDK
jgi:hypothetical protein